jgi:hypothetical protein
MAELAALRAKAKDRQMKDGALGTAEVDICLDLSLLEELSALEDERDEMRGTVGDPDSLVGARPVDTSEFDERIEAKKAEVRANSITVRFRALLSDRYQMIANGFDDIDGADQGAFFNELCAQSFVDARDGDGQPTDFTWDEVKSFSMFGEADEMYAKVFLLNRRRLNIPFSLNPSRKTR